MIFEEPLIMPSGDRAVRVAFGDERTLRVNRLVQAMKALLLESAIDGVKEVIPTYASLSVVYDQAGLDYLDLTRKLAELARSAKLHKAEEATGRILHIPVCYHDEVALDMDYICQYTKLDRKAIIRSHTRETYYVFQLGFTPGCPFIGPLQEALHVPLMQSPRTNTPKGTVAVSVGQTVIYPRATPGGMRIIGRTPVQLFQLDHPDLTLFKPGDRVRFHEISKPDFDILENEATRLYQGVEVESVAGA